MGGASSQHENELVLDVLRLVEPAFAVNANRQIVAWNDAAERLLGLKAEDVIGARCFDALAPHHGELCVECGFACPSREVVFQADTAVEALTPVSATTEHGKRVRVTTLTAHTVTGQTRVIHLLQRAPSPPAQPPASAQAPALAPASAPSSSGKYPRPTSLTQRELEVLRLLGAGHSTDDISRELSITRVTARNHVNKVLDKLGANSRLQAVVIASQLRLI